MKTRALLLALMIGCAGSGAGGGSSRKRTPIPPPGTHICPDRVIHEGNRRGAVCLESMSMGRAMVERCGSYLMANGWDRDAQVEEDVNRDHAGEFACYVARE
jgi:hypothetical protein